MGVPNTKNFLSLTELLPQRKTRRKRKLCWSLVLRKVVVVVVVVVVLLMSC